MKSIKIATVQIEHASKAGSVVMPTILTAVMIRAELRDLIRYPLEAISD
ncbi:MAG: hypothetical protein M2R45_01218 [Verrucomicrobia subdivision 3 bacterium]|nr:hypothetical protein [Limisphaerales bacterium]MCS1415230.1 hypothetical protein [Limisphaerales bacterium]